MRLPTPPELLFSAKAFAGALLALYLAFSLDLPRPYWALVTAYVVAQPFTGMTRSKAVYRFVGTLVGVIATIVLVPNLVNAPELLTAALAAWFALCLVLALLQEQPRNYAFLLAGFTAALVGFPSVTDPGAIFDTALARVEEISLGIFSAWLVGELVFPRAVGPTLRAGLDGWLAAAGMWASDVLRGRDTGADRQHLAAEAAALRVLATHADYEEPGLGSAEALQIRMRMLLPVLSGLRGRLVELRAQQRAPEAALASLAGWIERGGALPELPAATGPDDPLRAGTCARLRELVAVWQDCLALRGAVDAGGTARPRRHPRPHDLGLAALSALATVVTVGLCTIWWIATGWADGATATMMALIMCMFFAAQDDPAPAIDSFLVWVTLGSLLAGIWLFAVLPAISGFPSLAVALAVVLLPAGVLIARPSTTRQAIPFVFGFGGLLALQETYAADLPGWANAAAAQAFGLWIAATTTRLLRSIGAEMAIRRLLRAGRAELARLAVGQESPEPARFAARMLDRIAELAPRLAASASGNGPGEVDALAELRAGLNLLALRGVLDALPRRAARAVLLALATLARHFEERPAPSLHRRLARAIAMVGAAPPGPATLQAAVALDGLRRALPARAP